MVAPIYQNQPLQMSPSFSVKDAVESSSHTKESMTMPLLEMESESSSLSSSTRSDIQEYLDMSFAAAPKSKKSMKNNHKSVRFATDVCVHEIPLLTQQEKTDLFFSKQDKRNTKLELKRAITFWRAGRNNFFFDGSSSSQEEIIQLPQEERTKIGLEAHINPHMKISIRRRMTKLVLQHQDWSRQHPNFFDTEFLAQNCTTVAKSATLLALERAQTVINELKEDQREEGPMKNITVNMTNPPSLEEAASASFHRHHSVTIMCSPEPMPEAETTTVTPAIETVVEPKEARMEAPGQACMVR
jgi:hypothetical protein